MKQGKPLPVLHPLAPPLVLFELWGLFGLDVGLSEKWLGESWALSWALTLLTGILGITYAVWCWRGRSVKARSWAQMQWGADLAIIGIPFFSFAFIAIGLGKFLDLPRAIALAPGLGSAWLLIVVLAGFFSKNPQHDCPKWWGPKWFRSGEYKDHDQRPWDPLGALMTEDSTQEQNDDTTGTSEPAVASTDQVQNFVADAEPVASWSGGWVHDPDTDKQDHDAARIGTVEGTITYYPHGLTFTASSREDAIRNNPTVITIPTAEITQVTVVPARAGTDGQPRSGFAFRSPFPRLVVHTVNGPYLFDIARNQAKTAAETLTKHLDPSS